MNCTFENDGESEKVAGYRRYKCSRCGRVGHSPYELYRVSSAMCDALPPLTDHAEWLALFSAAVGIPQAKAAYDRWISGGAKVAELPEGVGRPLGKGPGTELSKLFKELGIKPTANCGCAEFQAKMDAWGPDGCREHREEILTFLRGKYDEASVLDKLRAGTLAAMRGLPMSIEVLLDLAIERAEKSSLENE